METRSYWRQSDRDFNPNFNRLWREPEWVVRLDKLLSGAVHGKPPPDPPDKERPAAAGTARRHLVQATFKTNASDYSRQVDKAKASRRARAEAEVLFARGGAR